MSYINPNEESGDDGFRIQNNTLSNEVNCIANYGIRLIDCDIRNDVEVELAYPHIQSAHQAVVYNYSDNKNFTFIDLCLNNNKLILKEGKCVGGCIQYGNVLKSFKKKGLSISLRFQNHTVSILLDKKQACKKKLPLDTNYRIGLLVSKDYSYSYTFFNVYEITRYERVEPSALVDDGQLDNKLSRSKDKIQAAYAHQLESQIAKSEYSERFELHSDDPTISTSARTEVTVIPYDRRNLREMSISFDIFLPEDYVEDELYEVLFQAHHTPRSDENNMSLNPNFAIRTLKDSWYATINGDPRPDGLEKHDYMYKTSNYLCRFKRGHWTHFDIYIKEGYLPEHNPRTIIIIDGEKVLDSNQPNCYNMPQGSYFKYGIYKADWKKGKFGNARKRVIYFDNLKVVI